MADRIAIMRAGKVVQIGAPRELYRDPGSPFVAEFLGETNFIPGVVQAAGGAVRVSTPAGMLTGRATTPIAVGAKVVCSIRPEAVRIGASGANPLAGRITHTTYLGEMAQLDIQLRVTPSGPAVPLKVSLLNPPVASSVAPPVAHPVENGMAGGNGATGGGEEVSLTVETNDVVVLPAV